MAGSAFRSPLPVPTWRATCIALAGILVTMGTRALLTPWLGQSIPFVLAYVGLVAVQALAGRRASALFVLGCLLWSQALTPRVSPPHALAFVLGSVLVVLFLDRLLLLQGRNAAGDEATQDRADANAGRALRALRFGLGMVLVLPTVFYAAVAWYTHEETLDEAGRRLDGLSRMTAEHAARVVETNRLIATQVVLSLEGIADAGVRAEQPLWHERLQRLAEGMQPVQTIWVWDAAGRPLVSNVFPHPPAGLDMRDRDYFRACRTPGAVWYYSQPYNSRTTGDLFFNISRCRRGADGQLLGVVTVSLRPEYFLEFYRPLVAAEPGVRLQLLRQDGVVLADTATPVDGAPPVTPPLPALADGGTLQQTLPGGEQGSEARVLRSLAGTPLLVAASLSRGQALAPWQRRMAVLAAATFPAAFAAAFVALIAMQRTRRELAAVARLREESEQRSRAEQALRQSQKLEALGQLTGGVAHDFNNLLMVIHTNAYLLGRRDPALAESRPLQALNRAVASGTQLTRQLLAFAKRQPLRPETLRLQEALPALADLLKTSVGSRVALEVTVAADTAPVLVDAAEMELALLNLALNARDAMPEGGALTMSAGSRGTGEQVRVAVEVKDTGSGIAPDLRDKVFEPFFSTKPPGQGTGLGLSQVWGFCEQAGGSVLLESLPGQGTTVTLLLPPAPPQAAAAPDIAAEPGEPALPQRVLMAEDNDEVASVTQQLLQSLGVEVRRVENADAGLRLLDAGERPDLLLSDVIMPGQLNGIGLARTVRERHPALPVLLMTGYTSELAAARQEGFRVLPKPFDVKSLQRALGEALGDRPLAA